MATVHIALPREDAELTKLALKSARSDWIQDARATGGHVAPSPYDDAINAFEDALGAHPTDDPEYDTPESVERKMQGVGIVLQSLQKAMGGASQA
jgi:hypothetical protein